MTPAGLRTVAFVLALLVGRADLLGFAVPLGAASYAAARKAYPRIATIAAAGILLGRASAGSPWSLLRLIVALLVVAALGSRPKARGTAGGPWASREATISAAVAVFISWLPGLLLSRFAPHEALLVSSELLAAVIVALALQDGLQQLAAGPRPDMLRSRAILTLTVLIAASLAGLAGLAIFGVRIASVVGALIVMLLARAGGGAVGTIAGVAVGLVGALSGEISVAYASAFAIAGLIAGIGGDLGTIGALAGYAIGVACLAPVVADAGYLGGALLPAAIAGPIALLLPAQWVSRARLICRGPDAAEEGTQMSAALWLLATARLSVLAHVFAELSQAFAEPAATATAVSAGGQASVLMHGGPVGSAPAAGEARRLLARQLAGVSGITADLADRMALGSIPAGLLRAREVEDALRKAGGQIKRAVLAPAEHGFEIHVETTQAGSQDCEWCGQRAAAAAGPVVGRCLHLVRRQCDLPGSGCYFALATEPRWVLEVGQRRRPHVGELVSGDSCISRRVGGHRHLLLLSDGMGTGIAAARESVTAVRMVEAMLDAGFGLETTLHTINTALLLRAQHEAFTTIDLALIDLAGGRLDMVKVGACPSYLYRDGKLSTLEAKAPPLGILEGIQIQRLSAAMRPGDILVMVSDGVFGGRVGLPRRQDWLARAISRHAATAKPQALADLLLEAAVQRSRSGRADDITVLVAALRRRGASG